MGSRKHIPEKKYTSYIGTLISFFPAPVPISHIDLTVKLGIGVLRACVLGLYSPGPSRDEHISPEGRGEWYPQRAARAPSSVSQSGQEEFQGRFKAECQRRGKI